MSDAQSSVKDAEDWQPVMEQANAAYAESAAGYGGEENMLQRLATLSDKMSHMTATDMDKYQFSEDDFEFKKILQYMIASNEKKGLMRKSTDVYYENLNVIGKNTAASIIKDVGDILLPFIIKPYERITHKKRLDLSGLSKTRKILRDVSGIAEPGTMTLVLGRPGSGCSTLLKFLSGETNTYVGYEGTITYSGIDSKDMKKHHSNNLVYNPELDVHLPFLTVEETLKFALAMKTPNVRVDDQTRNQFIENNKNLYEILFGLKHVEKTLVGNDFVRGISGGQRKRVSIAEAMATNSSVYCFDNATRGLDASTALEFAEALRTSTNVTKATSIVTIYQAAESIYSLFDYTTVLYSGRQIYFGPIDEAVQYFVDMGYYKGDRQTSPEFLTSVTDPLARTIREGFSEVPQTADEFAAYWKNSVQYKRLVETIAAKKAKYCAEETAKLLTNDHSLAKQKGTSKKSKYTTNYFEQLKWCTWRRGQTIVNNKAYAITQVIAATIQALVMGSLCYNITSETIGAFTRGGVVFFSLLYFAIMTLAETPVWFSDKAILNKQLSYTMYHPSAEYLGKQLTTLPVRIISVTFFAIVIYFLSGLDIDAGKFFQYYMLIILSSTTMGLLFTMLSAFAPTLQVAMGICGLTLMMTLVYSSYMIQRGSMYWWFKWFSYVNSVLYVFEAIMTMQFRGLVMDCSPQQLIPNGPGYENINTLENQVCGFIGAAQSKELFNGENKVSGEIYLKLAFEYVFSHAWRNFGILIGFMAGYIFITAIVVEIYNPIIASSDQLLFTKDAKLSKAIMYEIDDTYSEDGADTDSNSDLEKAQVKNEVLENSGSEADDLKKLGSDDIFLWKNVNYVVPYDGEQRLLLDNIQGYVLPGTLTALMGESGAGKTTLLNVLSKRTEVGVVTGDMLINGIPADSSFERRTGYVQQQDLHISQLTVRESLLFSARLRRPISVPDEEKVAYCETVMKILHMEDYADSIAGVPGYGLNVEQRKKLSIATELVAKPSLLLFLDEPTSGLDSQSSWAIIEVLKELAAAGQAILCTIHQPSATLFEEFDRLLLLRKGGQTVYFGDIGDNSRTMLDYFEREGARKCSDEENPAEYVLEVIGAGATASVAEDWNNIWIQSPEFQQTSQKIEQLIQESSNRVKNENDSSELHSTYATNYGFQFYHVLKRTWTQYYRSVPYIMPRLGFMIFGGLIVGFSFWDVKYTIIGMQNAMFACFLTMVISAPLSNQIQDFAIGARELFEVRESKSNTFHWSCLLLSQYLCELPFSIVFSTFYFVAWYFPIQFPRDAPHAGTWWLTYCIFFQLYYPSLALMVLYPSPDLETANILMGLIFSFIISFCGVVQRPSLMPGFWKFMWRVSPFTYFVGSELGITLHDRNVECATNEYNYLNPPSGQTCGEFLASYFERNTGYVNNPDDLTNCAVCQYRVGDEFLNSIGISHSQRWRNIGFFCVYIGFNLFLMCALFWVFRVKRINPASGIAKILSRFQKKRN